MHSIDKSLFSAINHAFKYEILNWNMASAYLHIKCKSSLHNQTPDGDQVTFCEQLSSTRESMGPEQVFQKGKQSFQKLSIKYRFHKQNVAQNLFLFFPCLFWIFWSFWLSQKRNQYHKLWKLFYYVKLQNSKPKKLLTPREHQKNKKQFSSGFSHRAC